MDIKMIVIQRSFDIAGNVIADLLSKPDWDARSENISKYYKDLETIKSTLPDAPVVGEIPEQREKEKTKEDEIVAEVCTPDLSPKELLECQECVREVVRNPDVVRKYMEPSP